jgi:DNA-directed RNA polymerase alpha subunit
MHWNKQSLATLTAYDATKGLVMLDPIPELPDNTPISEVDLPARIRNVLADAGLKTVGEVRESSDDMLLSRSLGEPSSAWR